MVDLLLPKLVRAALDNDLRSVRSISIQMPQLVQISQL